MTKTTRKQTLMTTKIVKLNNKSRQGLYMYIKKAKQGGRYYKYNPTITIDDYKTHYETVTIQKKKHRLPTPKKTTQKKITQPKTKTKNIFKKTTNEIEIYNTKITDITLKKH